MKFIKKNKVVIIFYIVLVAGVLLISENNKQYEKSVSTSIGIADTQK